MKFACVLTVLSASTAALASSLARRDAATLLSDISKIKAQAQKIYQDIQAYNNTTSSALTIYNDSNQLVKIIQNSTTDAINTAALSDNDSANIANSVVTLQPQIFQTLDALVAKRAGFTPATLGFDATTLVANSLRDQRTNAAYFGGNVTAKLSTALKKAAPLLTSNIDFHFARAQQAFATSS